MKNYTDYNLCSYSDYCFKESVNVFTTLGRSVRFADIPTEAAREGKRKKKRLVKKTKAITPLQAMMLRMAGTTVYLCHCCMLAKQVHLIF